MAHLTLLIKPASSLCNMRCRYCFYTDESQGRARRSMGIMSQETTQRLVAAALEYIGEGGSVCFVFQGGEPTLAGVDYFRHFVRCVEQGQPKGSQVHYAIQTNGYALDEALVALFCRHRFLVGVSLDGEKAIHDSQRPDSLGGGTWSAVRASLARLHQAGADTNVLCVVTRSTARAPQRTYRLLKEMGGQYHQYIPCLDPMEAERGSMPYSLTPKAYGKFLCGLFDCWYADWKKGQYVSIRLFEDFVFNAIGKSCVSCAASGLCGQYLVIEADGTAYPCDFYAVDRWELGNIRELSVAQLLHCRTAADFARERERSPAECTACPWRALCRGGCRRDWFSQGGQVHNYYCQAYRTFFAYARQGLLEIAQAEYRASLRGPEKEIFPGSPCFF